MSETYLHGSTTVEHQRLALMNRLLNERCLAEVAPEPGMRVLEVGAGTGLFAIDLAYAVGPTGFVVGVERDRAQLEEARACIGADPRLEARIELRRGDALDLPLTAIDRGSFDLVHARFLLEHLEAPARAVEQMLNAVRPGGRVVMIDDDHSLMRFHPPLASMDQLWSDYHGCFEGMGQHPLIGRSLAGLLIRCHAENVATAVVNFGACRHEPAFDDFVENLVSVIEGATPRLTNQGPWTEENVVSTLTEFRTWSHGREATILYPLPVASGQRALSH